MVDRKIAFVTAATDHGTLIVNRFDYNFDDAKRGYGVGYELLNQSRRESEEINAMLRLLDLRRQYFGDGVFAVDCGANIGIHTVEWAKHMTSWGSVLAIEPQERIYYALAGNIAINNCFNARALEAAVSNKPGKLKIPTMDYQSPASFGSLELTQQQRPEFIGQKLDYSGKDMMDVAAVSLDSFAFGRVDLIKIDVVGMELDVLAGGEQCIAKDHPILVVEWLKAGRDKLKSWFERNQYVVIEKKLNLFAVHQTDQCLKHVKAPK
jgi:FkbM family methyltransferase